MTEKTIVDVLGKYLVVAGHQIVCPNVSHLMKGQQDMISVTRKGMVIEYEVKISRSDFKRDERKGKGFSFDNAHLFPNHVPNQFFYVVPEGLISPKELPKYAGLYFIVDGKPVLQKAAPVIHKAKHDLNKIRMKVATLYQQRHFLGSCLLTYNNRGIKERNTARLKQYEEQRQRNTEAILKFKKK